MFDRNLSVDEKYNKLTALSENKKMDANQAFLSFLNYFYIEFSGGDAQGVHRKAQRNSALLRQRTAAWSFSKGIFQSNP